MVLGDAGSSAVLRVQKARDERVVEIELQRGSSEGQRLSAVLGQEQSLDFSQRGGPDDAGDDSCGLGITLHPPSMANGRVLVKRLKPGGAAELSGVLFPNDELLLLDGVQVANATTAQLRALVMGPRGSWSSLQVRRPDGALASISIQRTTADYQPASPRSPRAPMFPPSAPMPLRAQPPSPAGQVPRVGLGILFKEPDGLEGLEVMSVKKGSAADGKVHRGDRVISIDGTEIGTLESASVPALVKKPEGSPSICVLQRKDGRLDH
eukprot:2429315-Rhodomonas_salina.2